jgi:hypothetical protein
MDKKIGEMISKYAVFTLSLIVILVSGCETAKGFARGSGDLARGFGSAVLTTAKGVSEDTHNFFEFLKPADEWVKENLW